MSQRGPRSVPTAVGETCDGDSTPGPFWADNGSPFVWSASSLPEAHRWTHTLEADEITELAQALADSGVQNRASDGSDVGAFERPLLTHLCSRITAALRDGPGMFVVHGLPVEQNGEPDLARMLWGLCSMLGTPVPQTATGERIRRIEDQGVDLSRPSVRGHETNARLPLHSDRCDVVALLCVRPAREGGESEVVSAPRAHEVLRHRSPDLLQVLYGPYPNDQRGEERQDTGPWIPLPVFSLVEGTLITRYIRRFIEASQRFLDAPRLSALQLKALDALDDALDEPDAMLRMRLEAGDLQLLNSHQTLHGRSAFADPNGDPGRLLLRLWLAPAWSRRLPGAFAPLYGSVEPGTIRGGIAVRTE